MIIEYEDGQKWKLIASKMRFNSYRINKRPVKYDMEFEPIPNYEDAPTLRLGWEWERGDYLELLLSKNPSLLF